MALGTYSLGIHGFHKKWSGSLAKRRFSLGTASVINCTPLICIVLLSEFVSWNVGLQQVKSVETSLFLWDLQNLKY